MDKKITEGMKDFFERLGLPEEPFGMFYTDQEPVKGYSPNPGLSSDQRDGEKRRNQLGFDLGGLFMCYGQYLAGQTNEDCGLF